MKDTLSIISVVFREPAFWERNLRLTRRLNPQGGFHWFVVDNSETPALTQPPGTDVSRLDGVPVPASRDAESRHHALGIGRALARVKTRYVLILDHDFFIVMPEWVRMLTAHVRHHNLSFFGSRWHPRWFWQYRDFPSVHCLLIDLEKVAAETLDFTPAIHSDRYWRFINKPRWFLPEFIQSRLKATRIRDTGWRVRRDHVGANDLGIEILPVVYQRPDTAGARFEQRFGRFMPDSWKLHPPGRQGFVADGFLAAAVHETAGCGWEEFFWNGQPFGFHLRRFGRSMMRDPIDGDFALLDKVIGHYADS